MKALENNLYDKRLLKGCINFIESLQKGNDSLNTGQVQIWRSSGKL